MPRMMVHPHARPNSPGPKPVSQMTYRLRRQTPNVGYAEIEVVHHPGSHHQPGDIILIDWDDYERAKYVEPPNAPSPSPPPQPKPEETSRAIADFLAINPHARGMADNIPPQRSKTNDARRKSKGKNKQALKKL